MVISFHLNAMSRQWAKEFHGEPLQTEINGSLKKNRSKSVVWLCRIQRCNNESFILSCVAASSSKAADVWQRNTHRETQAFPRTITLLYAAGGKPYSLSASLCVCVCSCIFCLFLHILDMDIWLKAAVFNALFSPSNIPAGIQLNILCLPSRCCSCRIWSDPVGWRRRWGAWQDETLAAICTQGLAMEGLNTSCSFLTGTYRLP